MASAGLSRVLVSHFFGRFFDTESLSPQGEPEAAVVQTLGILAAPSGFVAILVAVLHVYGWELVSLRCLFVSYNMIAMGIVMVFEWDALFPDRRDYLILTPLPLRAFQVFVGKLCALTMFVGMFLVAINFFSIFLWSAIETRGGYFAVTGPYVLVMFSAGLFAALSIAALQGILVTVFRGALYRRVSAFVRTAVMAVLVMFLFLSPLLGGALQQLSRAHSPYLGWFPPFWFTALYEHLRPAVRGEFTSLAPLAWRGLGIAAAIFAVTFLPGYRSHARRILEAPEPNPKGPGRIAIGFDRLVRTILRDPVEYGAFHFISQSISRSLKHRLFLATYGGLGAAIIVMNFASGANSDRVPLTLSFILISGLRAAFNFPSDLRANWAFRVSETSPIAAYVRATRKWITIYAIVPLFLLLAAIEAVTAPSTAILFHFAYGVALSLVLMEVLFLDYRKVPFTCSHFPGKINLVFLGVIYCFGFTYYSDWMSALEAWLWSTPVAAIGFFLGVAVGLGGLARVRRQILHGEAALDYEDDGDPVVRTLGLQP